MATYPADGQGTLTAGDAGVDCDSPTPDCAVPTDAAIELRFDRFLLPGAGLATGLVLYTGDRQANQVGLAVAYDLIERVVVVHHAPLHPNTLYTVEIAQGQDPAQGFWAFDRAPLEDGPVPLRFSFTTGSGPGAPQPMAALLTDDCRSLTANPAPDADDSLRGPLSGCLSCHRNPPLTPPSDPASYELAYPPMGLSLSAWGLRHTAIEHVAHETETTETNYADGVQGGPRFGAQMSLVEPGSPANSYLLYKLLIKPENYALDSGEACPALFHPPVSDAACTPPDAAELARLGDWFVLGQPMPFELGSPTSLTRDQLTRVVNWIAAGAACPVP